MKFYAFPDKRRRHRILSKILLVMKLTIILLVAALLQVHAATIAQTVTLNKKNIPLSQVFKEIKKQTGYDFLYSPDMVEQAKPVSLQVTNQPLETVLQQCFAGQDLTYTIDQKTIVVRKKEPEKKTLIPVTAPQGPIDVTGTVLDEQNKTVSGATVQVKGTNNATITDAKGQFTLKNVPDNAIIVVSFIGYQKQELPATPDLGKIKLVVATNQLDAIQIQAYGTTSQRLTVGNISGITSADIENQPVDNPLLALEGKVPGLLITQTSGIPGSAVIRHRGHNPRECFGDPAAQPDL